MAATGEVWATFGASSRRIQIASQRLDFTKLIARVDRLEKRCLRLSHSGRSRASLRLAAARLRLLLTELKEIPVEVALPFAENVLALAPAGRAQSLSTIGSFALYCANSGQPHAGRKLLAEALGQMNWGTRGGARSAELRAAHEDLLAQLNANSGPISPYPSSD